MVKVPHDFVSNIVSWLRGFKVYYRQQKAAMAANALTDLVVGFTRI